MEERRLYEKPLLSPWVDLEQVGTDHKKLRSQGRKEGRKVEVPNVDTCMQFWHFEMDINDATLFEGRNLSHFIVTSFSLVLWLSFVSMFTM